MRVESGTFDTLQCQVCTYVCVRKIRRPGSISIGEVELVVIDTDRHLFRASRIR